MTGTEVYADEAGAWNELHGGFAMHRINHQEAYSLRRYIYTNNACAQIGFYSAKIVASALKIIA